MASVDGSLEPSKASDWTAMRNRLRDIDWSLFWRVVYRVHYVGEGNLVAYEKFEGVERHIHRTRGDARRMIAEYVVWYGTGAIVNDFVIRRDNFIVRFVPKIVLVGFLLTVSASGLISSLSEAFQAVAP